MSEDTSEENNVTGNIVTDESDRFCQSRARLHTSQGGILVKVTVLVLILGKQCFLLLPIML